MRYKKLLLTLIVASLFFTSQVGLDIHAKELKSNLEIKDIYNDKDWKLVWRDEFNGFGKPDESRWGSVNQQRHGNVFGPDMYWKDDMIKLNGKGQLSVKIKKVPNLNNDHDKYDLASGMIRTKGKFEKKYGKFEIRCKLPKEQGWWVAFWLMSDGVTKVNGNGRDGTEIDILEAFGWNNNIHHALHWDGYGPYRKSAGHSSKIYNHDIYHTYALVWTPNEYRYYIDGKISWITNRGGVSQVPQYIKISGEASTKDWMPTKSWAENPDNATYPDEFLVDYVRVYDYDFGVKEKNKKKTPFVVKGIKPSKKDYNFGDEVKWQTDVQGDNLKYQYYLSRKGKVLEKTKYSARDSYSFTPKEPGYYTILAFAYDGNEIKRVGENKIRVLDKKLKINKTKANTTVNSITWEVEAEGDGLIYSFYVIKNGERLKYIPYGEKKSVTIKAGQDGVYDVLAYVQDEYGNILKQWIQKVDFKYGRTRDIIYNPY